MNQIDILNSISDASVLEAFTRLTSKAHALTINNLEIYGNRLAPSHSSCILRLQQEFGALVFGIKTGRYAYPLPTGMGKTQSVIGFCTALVTEGFDNKSVVVSATKVEALAGIKRELIANGVPEARIGLIHSYSYDPSIPRDALPEGYASEPSTSDNDDRQIMLVTHNRIKGGKLDRFNWYRGEPRNLVIWDESLLVSKSRMLSSHALKKSLGHLRPDLATNSPALEFFDAVMGAVEHELERQRAGAEPQRLALPEFDDNLLHAIRSEVGKEEVQEILRQFLDIVYEPLRVIEDKQGQAVVAYDIIVPRELQSIAILDASYPIRELEKMDKTIQLGCHFPADLKRFDQVQLHHLKSPSGRCSVTSSFSNAKRVDRKISREVCDLILEIPQNSGVIVFTFKTQSNRASRRRSPDFKSIIKSDLKEVGVDVDAKLPDGDRIVFLTWGQETSLSEYSYCTHVIFAGVLHRDHLQIASEMIGQRDDLYAPVQRSAIKEVVNSEIAHSLYQAISRGCCRIIDGNQALAMNVWLIHGNDDIRPMLEQMMPGLQWLSWKPKHLDNREKLQMAAKLIAAYLEQLPSSVTEITTQALRKAVGVDVCRNYFRKALEMAVGVDGGWELVRRGIERQESFQSENFKEAA